MSSEPDMELYDLRVTVEEIGGRPVCGLAVGDYFELTNSSQLRLPANGHFCLYALAAALPLLPAKQRPTHENDWMTSDEYVADPDPNCGAVYRITRTGKTVFRRADVTATPPPSSSSDQ